MSEGARFSIRYPLLLIALGDLALLVLRLRPLQDVSSLPGQGTGFDPAICLVAYAGLVLWFTGRSGSRMTGPQPAVTLFGLLAGALLALRFWMAGLPTGAQTREVQAAVAIAAAIVWGLAGVRAARAAGKPSAAFIPGIWGGTVSALLACAVVLGQFFVTGPAPDTPDTYKQFLELGIGSPSTVVLVRSLTAATALMLLCPLLGGALALIFGVFAGKRAA
jgi:hypothetical protein